MAKWRIVGRSPRRLPLSNHLATKLTPEACLYCKIGGHMDAAGCPRSCYGCPGLLFCPSESHFDGARPMALALTESPVLDLRCPRWTRLLHSTVTSSVKVWAKSAATWRLGNSNTVGWPSGNDRPTRAGDGVSTRTVIGDVLTVIGDVLGVHMRVLTRRKR